MQNKKSLIINALKMEGMLSEEMEMVIRGKKSADDAYVSLFNAKGKAKSKNNEKEMNMLEREFTLRYLQERGYVVCGNTIKKKQSICMS